MAILRDQIGTALGSGAHGPKLKLQALQLGDCFRKITPALGKVLDSLPERAAEMIKHRVNLRKWDCDNKRSLAIQDIQLPMTRLDLVPVHLMPISA